MNTDLSFITNEENQTLKERFEVLIKDTSFFDCLVGYFYSKRYLGLCAFCTNVPTTQPNSFQHIYLTG